MQCLKHSMERYLRDSSLVQSVERRTVNPYVAGSSPARGAIKMHIIQDSSLVQSVERRTVNPYVAGSSPARGATKNTLF